MQRALARTARQNAHTLWRQREVFLPVREENLRCPRILVACSSCVTRRLQWTVSGARALVASMLVGLLVGACGGVATTEADAARSGGAGGAGVSNAGGARMTDPGGGGAASECPGFTAVPANVPRCRTNQDCQFL